MRYFLLVYDNLYVGSKVKPVVWLRDVHAKQCNSLQAREQQLLDIIEDIRLVVITILIYLMLL